MPRCAAKACPNKMPTRKTSRSPDLQKFCRGCVENLCKDLWHAQRRGSQWSREEIISARVRGERLPTGVMAGARRMAQETT